MSIATQPLRLAFMGTPDFAVPTLKALIAAGHDVAAVYTQPPSRAGRGKKLKKSPVHNIAEAAGIEVRTPTSLKSEEEQVAFAALNLDICVVVAYGQILPKDILDAPTHGCVNVHASLLPRWRGAAPIHRAIMAGDCETGVCIMKMDVGLDTGPVISQAKVPIKDDSTTALLHDTLSELGASMINRSLAGYIDGALVAKEQSSHGVTYANKIEKAEAAIDWSKPALEIDRQIRGLCPFPGAYTMHGDERIKILGGSIEEMSGEAGTVLDDALLVGCGGGSYRIDRAQRAGKAAMDRDDFLRGKPITKGSRFSS